MFSFPLLLRVLLGDAPGRALRRADRYAREALALLREVRDDVAEVGVLAERLDAVDRRLAVVEGHAASLDTSIPQIADDVAALRAEARELRRLVPGEDPPGPLERAKQAVTGD